MLKPVLTKLAATFSGAILPLAFAPYDWPIMAVLSPLLFLFIIQQLSARQAAVAGYFFGLGYFGHGVYWVYFSIHHFAHAPLWLAIIIMLGMVAILALYMALLGYGLNRYFKTHLGVRYLLAFPSLWLGLEVLRGFLFTGFPWLSLGYSQIDTPLAAWAPLLGVFGVSYLLALIAGAILCLLRATERFYKLAATAALLFVFMGSYLLSNVAWTSALAKPIKVALVQGNIPQEIKWLPTFRQRSIDIYLQMTRQHRDADLIVWPETAIPVFHHRLKDNLMPLLRQEAQQYQSDIVLGLPVMSNNSDDYYNGLHSVRFQNEFYFKRHLVPLGEYMPLKPLSKIILDFLQIPLSDFSAGGDHQSLLKGGGYPFASSICYEDVFQQTSIDGLPEAAYLLNVSNDTWFGDTIAPYQHFQMARMRALESGRYLLRATNTGLTAIINAQGKVTAQAPMFSRTTLTGELTPFAGVTPFVKAGWCLIYVLLACLLLWSFVKRDVIR